MTDTSSTAERYASHHQQLCQLHESALQGLGFDSLAIYAGSPKIAFLDDYHFPFKANPHFLWWLPLEQHPESWVVVRPGQKPQLIYHQPEDYWHLPPSDPQGVWTEHFDIVVTGNEKAARAALPADLSRCAVIGENPPDWSFADINPQTLVNRLHWRRAAKSDYELDLMRSASRSGARAHQTAASAFENGDSEYEIHLKYIAACQHAEKELPYNNIIALNDHAAVLHYQNLSRDKSGPRHSFLIDAGAICDGYASDITRTYAEPGSDFGELVSAMEARQLQMVDDVRAGASYPDLHIDCHRHVAELLEAFDVVNMPAQEMIEHRITSTFLPHGLGHLIGLQVHDVGGHQAGPDGGDQAPPASHPFLRTTRTLEAGYVVTIEPGLYFIPQLLDELKHSDHGTKVNWKRVEQFLPYGGIRIEDDVVAQESGPPENLTRDAFASLKD
ncbi:MAG: Xaa-Pro dipeptidase [Lysobacterales bacterium]